MTAAPEHRSWLSGMASYAFSSSLIALYLNVHNADPKPYVWTATAESILTKVQRTRAKLQHVVSQN